MGRRDDRRTFLTLAGVGLLAAGCRSTPAATAATRAAQAKNDRGEEEKEVTATEDLMREHGVIRRVLVVYREVSPRLVSSPRSVQPDLLQKAARLIRNFGEDYHEKLEEAHLFPALKKAGGPGAKDVDTLLLQHQRGREITDYVLAITQRPIGASEAEPLARALEAFARMYAAHTAREDTVVFPAWKALLSAKQLDEMGELFEDIEHQTFGKDGFDDAVAQVAAIEQGFGIGLAGMTAPPPPRG